MIRIGKYVLAGFIVGLLAHFAVLHATPRFIMAAAMERLSGEGAHFNQWTLGERVTEASRTIVRPSPDFAYATCVYDLRNGPVTIHVAPWEQYWSLSFYSESSDNYYTLNDRDARGGAEITLVRAGRRAPDNAVRVIESPSQKGVAILRRLAPSAERFRAAEHAAQEDVCAITPA